MQRLLSLRMLLLAPVTVLVTLVPVPSAGAKTKPRAKNPLAAVMVENPAPFVFPKRTAAPVGVKAASIARRFVGVPYRWGGASPSGFDCSGFVSYVYGRVGVAIPHNAAAAYGYGRPVSVKQLRPGDLLFYRGLGHVGMYLGRGKWIHAPQSGASVRIDPLTIRSDLVGARRLVRA